jgi:signal transduction histidine kinase/CheY-like chemotaxis protein/HPt (histidine-containing phosphotransfer) domain-containing protein
MAGPLPEFLRELGFVLLEHKGHGQFELLSPAPTWLTELWELPPRNLPIPIAEKSPFLENFLFEADAFWDSNRKGICQSETWVEKSPAGREIPLEAIALQWEGKCYLALHSAEPQFQERFQLLQTARNSLLDHERLQREIQKKEILLHCIIHDLSQPLSVMSVAFDCMTGEQISSRGKSLLELGKKAGDQQSTMIRDILQVFSADLKASLIAENQTTSAPDLLACAESVLKAFTPVYAAKGVRLQLAEGADKQAQWPVNGEATRIERIFSNLLENALRYTPAGSAVTIALAHDGGFVRAFVDDEGPGLPADLSPSQIFALFSKGKENGGKAGLGLYFCRLTVERWGGTIGCENLPHKGSRFWFRLPQAAASPSHQSLPQRVKVKARMNQAKSRPPRKSPARVLLADDQSEIRMLTADQLQRTGHHVVAVANGKEALAALQREAFDVALLDEDMPVMTGPEVLKAIREKPTAFGPTMVVALTGYNSDPDRERLLHLGFDAVIGKPFRLDSLDELLRGTASPASSSATEERPLPGAPRTPAENLLQRVGGDEKLARRMIATFLRDTPKRVIAMEKALRERNGVSLVSLAHAVKGSVSIFGANLAREHAEKLQESARADDFTGLAADYDRLKEEIAKLEANLRGYAGQKRSPSRGASPKTKRRRFDPKRKSR